ncbi:MAG: SWIM zinc finger domain-containing protein [Eubacterium sp.]|nr:SWIM zinc finger domain-containing protein [Eubacterium sp.]
MALIDIASSKSVWRGMEYYKQNMVRSCELNEDGTYEGRVAGSGEEDYKVHLDLVHPRKSTCNCPLADGKQIICKHIVAVSFCVDASEAERFKNEKTVFESEEDERRTKKYEKYLDWAKHMSKSELNKAYAELMVELDEIRYKEQYGR